MILRRKNLPLQGKTKIDRIEKKGFRLYPIHLQMSKYIRATAYWVSTLQDLPRTPPFLFIQPDMCVSNTCTHANHGTNTLYQQNPANITVAVFFWYGTEIKIKITFLVLWPHFSCSLCWILRDNPWAHSQMGHYFVSYLLTWDVDLIEILENMPQMWQYVIFLSLKLTLFWISWKKL